MVVVVVVACGRRMGDTAGHMPAGEQEAENRGSEEGAGQRWAAERGESAP